MYQKKKGNAEEINKCTPKTHANDSSTGGESNPGESPDDSRDEARGGGDAASSSYADDNPTLVRPKWPPPLLDPALPAPPLPAAVP